MRKYAQRHHHPRAADRDPVAWRAYAVHVMAIIREEGLVSERWVWKATNVLNVDIRV
jgi:hypothetical protein